MANSENLSEIFLSQKFKGQHKVKQRENLSKAHCFFRD